MIVIVAIVAAVAATTGGKKNSASSSTGPPVVVAARPSTPGSLAAKVSPFKVVLTWAASTGDFVGYRVFRDGSPVDVVASPTTAYTDAHALPKSTYSYAVEAYSQSGNNSEQALVQVKTPKAPLSAARLTGVYNMTLKETSKFGLQGSAGRTITDGWRFKPLCEASLAVDLIAAQSGYACDVNWNELGHKSLGAKLKRTGASYAGTDPSSTTATCNGVNVSGSVAVSIKVVKAAIVGGIWMATAIKGTMVFRTPAALGCVSSGADYAVSGKVVR